MEPRKQAISVRLSSSDVRNLRKLSRRLGVRTSDVVRFAVRTTLARLGPLNDPDTRGRALVPVFVEAGAEMMRYLDLDAVDMEMIINDGASPGERVEHEDVQLLAMSGAQQPYARLRLVHMGGSRSSSNLPPHDHDIVAEEQLLGQTLRKYFYDKYVFESVRPEVAAAETKVQAV